MNPRDQKNHLRRKLNDIFGHELEVETTVDSIESISAAMYPDDYADILTSLSNDRGNRDFDNNNRKLECDFVIKSQKIIVEYDERQHFTRSRAISLASYPNDICLGFDKQIWAQKSDAISAHDNDPKDRDERRAFYDSIRDIEGYRNGWIVIRFFHDEIDWSSNESLGLLKKRISSLKKKPLKCTRHKTKIIRIIHKKQYDSQNKDKHLSMSFDTVSNSIPERIIYDYLITPGGFLSFKWPILDEKNPKSFVEIEVLKKIAFDTIMNFWCSLKKGTKENICKHVKYITFSIDSENSIDSKIFGCVQLVALFSTSKMKIIHITGKSYSTAGDIRNRIVEETNLDSHFVQVGSENICILGCHDLKMFSPRSKSLAKHKKAKTISKMNSLLRRYKPSLILQHPHNTDTWEIWNTEWKSITRTHSFIKDYASAIRYYNGGSKKRKTLKDVLNRTASAYILDVIYDG